MTRALLAAALLLPAGARAAVEPVRLQVRPPSASAAGLAGALRDSGVQAALGLRADQMPNLSFVLDGAGLRAEDVGPAFAARASAEAEVGRLLAERAAALAREGTPEARHELAVMSHLPRALFRGEAYAALDAAAGRGGLTSDWERLFDGTKAPPKGEGAGYELSFHRPSAAAQAVYEAETARLAAVEDPAERAILQEMHAVLGPVAYDRQYQIREWEQWRMKLVRDGYFLGGCDANVAKLVDRLAAKGVDLSGARVVRVQKEDNVFVQEDYGNAGYQGSVIHARRLRHGAHLDGWSYHVVLEHGGKIYDLEYTDRLQAVPEREYWREMFGWEDGPPADVRVERRPAVKPAPRRRWRLF